MEARKGTKFIKEFTGDEHIVSMLVYKDLVHMATNKGVYVQWGLGKPFEPIDINISDKHVVTVGDEKNISCYHKYTCSYDKAMNGHVCRGCGKNIHPGSREEHMVVTEAD